VFDRVRANPRVWHFGFHSARDVAEALVAGRERLYLQAFFAARIFNPAALDASDLDHYAEAYAAPGAMRAAFELYRAFEQDAIDNQQALRANGKLTIPVLAVWGAISNSGPLLADMMGEVADRVTGIEIPGAGHWIPEENPVAFVSALIGFLNDES
jgi:pimeloyl-ACP methyl ester carboxylesterase